MAQNNECEFCLYLDHDEETDEDYCTLILDQDDYEKWQYDTSSTCKHFRRGDDYTIVKKQGF